MARIRVKVAAYLCMFARVRDAQSRCAAERKKRREKGGARRGGENESMICETGQFPLAETCNARATSPRVSREMER